MLKFDLMLYFVFDHFDALCLVDWYFINICLLERILFNGVIFIFKESRLHRRFFSFCAFLIVGYFISISCKSLSQSLKLMSIKRKLIFFFY